MKPGDFIAIHTEDGCIIGRMILDDGEFVTADIGGNIFEGIPKNICTLWVSV